MAQSRGRALVSGGSVVTTGGWIGDSQLPLAGWRSDPATGPSDVGVLIVPPLAYEYWSSYRSLRSLSLAIAAAGLSALRFDLPGTGNSAGDPREVDQWMRWQGALRQAADVLRNDGCRWIAVVGLRLGATLALTQAADLGADAVLAWFPVVNGRRYVRELRLLGTEPPDTANGDVGSGGVISGGVPFTAQTLQDVAAVKLDRFAVPPAPNVLVMGKPGEPTAAALCDTVGAAGSHAELWQLAGADTMLDVSCERAVVPQDAIAAVVHWLLDAAPTPARVRRDQAPNAANIDWQGSLVREELVTLGSAGLQGILGNGETPAASDVVVVFLNPGAEHNVGPGRAWVEYSRALNAAGYATVRLDFRGWGESPDAPTGQPGAAYDAHTIDDVRDAVTDLESRGFAKVVLVGLCASSWVALRAVLRHPVAGVFALNIPFVWQPGVPVDMTVEEGEIYMQGTMRSVARGERWRVWSLLDVMGMQSANGRWLNRVSRTGTAVRLVYAEGDIGVRHLRQRLGRRIARVQRRGTITVDEIPDIDHQMHRSWLRPEVSRRLLEFVADIGGAST